MAKPHVNTYFDPDTGHFLLQLSREEVGLGNEPLEFEGKTFQPKDEVHITIIGSKLGAELAEMIRAEPELAPEIQSSIDEFDWSYRLLDEWHHIVREEGEDGKGYAESIIRMVNVPHINEFYRQMHNLTSIEIAPRPTHITLYTLNDAHGIGISTWEAFERLAKQGVTPEKLELV